jgi:hypothetical protein
MIHDGDWKWRERDRYETDTDETEIGESEMDETETEIDEWNRLDWDWSKNDYMVMWTRWTELSDPKQQPCCQAIQM